MTQKWDIQPLQQQKKTRVSQHYNYSYFDGPTQRGYQGYFWGKMLKSFRAKIATVKKHRANGCLLDVGCAKGFFVKIALQAGFDSYGAEFSAYAIQHTGQPARSRTVHADLEYSLPFKQQAFDVVTGWDFLEHLQDPQRFLKRINKALKPEGFLFLTTVNHDSLMARLMRSNWLLKGRLHLSDYITPNLLKTWLHNAGFEPLIVATFDMSLKPLPRGFRTLQFIFSLIITAASPLFAVTQLGCNLLCVAQKRVDFEREVTQ